MKNKLLPCPFCGGKASTFHIPINAEDEMTEHPKWKWNNPGMWVVGCDTEMCMGNINHVTMVFADEELAIDTWNKRAGGWIPCSERLPENEAKEFIKNELDGVGYLYPLLLTYRSPNTEKVHVVRFYWSIYDKCFVNNGEDPCEIERCIAWMPLPEPYRQEGD